MSDRCWGISGRDSTPSGLEGNKKTVGRGGRGCARLHPVQENKPGLMGRVKQAQSFIKRDLWLALPDARGPRFLYRALRMGVLIVEGFIKTDVFMLSAALTYQVIFALVP